MLSKKWLVAVFLLSLLSFMVLLLPASLPASYADGMRIGRGTLQLDSVYGRWWRGQAVWRWQDLSGNLVWTIEWRGMTPGLDLAFNGSVRGEGWVGGTTSSTSVRDVRLSLSGETASRVVPGLRFGGTVSARGLSVTLDDRELTDATGQLVYTGGVAQWRSADPVTVPPLRGNIENTNTGARLTITSPEANDVLALAAVEGNKGRLTVYRAWPAVLGLSRGGDPGDVVFETSLPLWQ